ncbi:hypothetical protein L593_03580 [Salinarchaeum sp. Harcht-Bsk1]|uniref:hypothetical protein n=1 Tax=Salinarchaeum sp. Harcht-Bsk1 TaxID=1333523 RepID=UPI00034239ED|nr:hypothetical protein [Salinarchaeum sp. Harcht-Bsk1]AGN00667.1 hypothetical protein L593_03580 [Salinarchaeum sp. Harcht-Bsk1]
MPDTPTEPDDESDADTGATRADSTAGEDESAAPTTVAPAGQDDVNRRWLIRLLVALGIGIPILVEGATLLRMLRSFLLGGGGGGGNESDSGGDPDTAVEIGDEILPETPPPEILRRAVVVSGENVWEFQARIRVENTGEDPYTFRVSALRTDEGKRIADPVATERLAPGEPQTLDHTWRMPAGERPASFEVLASTETATGTERVERTVELGSFPLQN